MRLKIDFQTHFLCREIIVIGGLYLDSHRTLFGRRSDKSEESPSLHQLSKEFALKET